MGFVVKFTLLALTILSSLFMVKIYDAIKPLPAPKIDANEYWGTGSAANYKSDSKPTQMQIGYNDKVLEALRLKLNDSVELQAPLKGAAFTYGVSSLKMLEFIDYWKDNYLLRWSDRENYLNAFPHYVVNIQGLDIHYIHTKATYDIKGKRVVPLLLIHGWPGSVREFYEIIPKLALPTDDLDIVFEVVAPSLPGYGWSEGANRPGMGYVKMAVVLRNLMIKLGYTKFYIQGGDWGSALGSSIATLFPENVIGYHSNMCFVDNTLNHIKAIVSSYFPSWFIDDEYADFIFPRLPKLVNLLVESGYMHLQATKPDTLGIALTSNPIGLAAYILEKFSTWTNPAYRQQDDGGFDNEDFTKDALLDNIMIYYLSSSITTSMRLYAESFGVENLGFNLDRVETNVPTGCARFKHDIAHAIDWQLKTKFTNLVHSTYHKDGGHFIAMQKPDLLYADFVEFVKKVESLEK